MKKLVYSKGTKFIVWLLIIALTVPFVDCLHSGIRDYMELGGDSVYAFGADFESSYYVAELLNMPINALGFSYMESNSISQARTYHGNGSVSVQVRETEAVPVPTAAPSFIEPMETVSPKATPTPRPTGSPSEPALRQDEFYERLEKHISYFAEDERIEYYIKVNDRVYTNSDAKSPEKLLEQEFSYLYSRQSDGSVERSWNGAKGRLQSLESSFGLSGYAIGEDEIKVCSAIVDSHANEMRRVWTRQEQIVKDSFEKLLYILGAILLLSAFLLATAGKSPKGAATAGIMDRLWTEVYLALSAAGGLGGVCLTAALFDELFEASYGSYYGSIPEYMAMPLIYVTAALTVLVAVGCLVMCVRKLRLGRFLSDSICWTLLWLCLRIIKYVNGKCLALTKKLCKLSLSFVKNSRSLIIAANAKKSSRYMLWMVLGYTAFIGFCGILTPEAPIFLFIAIAGTAAAIWYLLKRSRDLDSIRTGTALIRKGQLNHKIAEPHSADLETLAADINHIAQGLDESVGAKLKAERMKTELITNVSHDLKTPLTSMISYTELLSQVEGLPEEAQDYIKIIASKSDKLKKLTQDLFDISKVQSGSERIVMEKLDAALLIEQTLAEHESEIGISTLNFIVNTEKGLSFLADGKKMSRVLGNITENILKYSMAGTRVFISAKDQNGRIVMEFKNIASYLMDFDPEEIVGRFVRGDDSRSTEGSGLGLAIAKSYVEACKGSFDITVDGDLFKVGISFDKAE